VDLSLGEHIVDGRLVIEVRGEADVHSAGHLRDRLTSRIDTGSKNLILDLSQLGFIDSTGLGALVAARNHAEAHNADLKLVCASERLLKLFRITGLVEVFAIYGSVLQAVEAGTPGPLPSTAS
jgi:anti-sigma B factor antagonist